MAATNTTGVATTDNVAVNGVTLLNVNMANVAKLTASNYLLWSRQVYSLLDGYELASYLDGSKPIPDPLMTTATSVTANPEYVLWKRQDKLIFSAILGALSLMIQPILSRATTSADIWNTLANTYAKPSRGHIKQLKIQLKQWKKGFKTIDEYLQGLITKFDQRALLGKVIDHEDQIKHILDGLPEEYKSIGNQTNAHDTPPTILALHEKLLNHEASILAVSESIAFSATENYINNCNWHNNQSRSGPRPHQNWSQPRQ